MDLRSTASIKDDTPLKVEDSAAGPMISVGCADLVIFLSPAAEDRLRELLNIRQGRRAGKVLRFRGAPAPVPFKAAGDVVADILDRGLTVPTINDAQPTSPGDNAA